MTAGEDRGFRTVSNSQESQDVPEVLDGSLVALEDVQQVLFREDGDLQPMDSPAEFVGRSRRTGRGGGGGSGFGGSVLGKALLGAGIGAALGVGIAAAIDDDDDDVASPFTP
ncbi:MAG: hypothetical protein HQ582_24020 [Planctomycetes bacterium]|nr:hypothetical protein [Planctomycetota bacterium]